MSADLLGLDEFYKRPTQAAASRDGAITNTAAGGSHVAETASSLAWSNGLEHRIGVVDGDEDFGDFEGATYQKDHNPAAPYPNRLNTSYSHVSPNDNTIFWDGGPQGHAGKFESSSLATEKKPVANTKPRDENGLFDAENEIEDNFGDFEEAEVQADSLKIPNTLMQATAQAPMQSLIDFDDEPKPVEIGSMPSAPKSGLKPWPKSSVGFGQSKRSALTVELQNASLAQRNMHAAWDDFQEASAAASPANAWIINNARKASRPKSSSEGAKSLSSATSVHLVLDTLLSTEPVPDSTGSPTSIPPPAVIISAFAPILRLVQDQLHQPLAEYSHDDRTASLALPSTQLYVMDVIRVAIVLGHVIAGRKVRWKRDTRLAQSMRIGPASSSGRSGGMKLTGVDKAESSREDREVTDILRTWRAQAGKLRSIITAAGLKETIPDLGDSPVIRLAQTSEGAITSLRPCALCGIKRSERVAKIDVEVQDNFGEWWVEHWGHKDCMMFWNRYEKDLRSR
ncbi:MAG: hypothetical protein M1828_002128 [Chrysothrix sp. TS-e1954]|nr:MAG: hypothetical protein M1828_002128 [Chrysothrix sp. TS-e1954]